MRFLRDNGLSIMLMVLFLGSLTGMMLTGQAEENAELAAHGAAALSLGDYLASGPFLSALFENWESEFLQMAMYVVLTAMLFQRGSAESRDPDAPDRPGDAVVWPEHSALLAWLYANSLGLILFALFLLSFALHWHYSLLAANSEAARHGEAARTQMEYLGDPRLWFESFQNWQSEFLSTAVLVVASIFLRQRGSPESKPVGASNRATGA